MKEVRQTVMEFGTEYGDTLDNWLKQFTDIKAAYPDEELHIELKSYEYYEDSSVEGSVYYWREKTEEEKARDAEVAERLKEIRRKQYLDMKKEFENE